MGHISLLSLTVRWLNAFEIARDLFLKTFGVWKFDLIFTFLFYGWEGGSAHDSMVYNDARPRGFTCPPGKSFFANAAYILSRQCLTPYRGVRYHFNEWRRAGNRPETKEELFNLRHASLRNVIERIFGVLKSRFPLCAKMHPYSLEVQIELVMCEDLQPLQDAETWRDEIAQQKC